MQVIARSCLALAVTIFCLTIVACYVSVSFLNVCYVGFGPVFFCTYEECKALIKLSGSPQGHPLFVILAATYGMHVAHCRSTHAEAFTLLKLYCPTHPGIHSAAIMRLHLSIICSTPPSSCSQYLSAHWQGLMSQCVCALICLRSLVYTELRAQVSEFSEHRQLRLTV